MGMLTALQKKKVSRELLAHRYVVYLISFEEMDKIIHANKTFATSKTKLAAWDRIKEKAKLGADYFATGKDVLLLNTLLADFGYVSAQAYIKVYKGVPHIILKGRPGFRKIFTAARYRLDNAKVIEMGLGKLGAIDDAEGGGILTIILLTVYRVADYFLTDNATLSQLFGSLSTDIVKVGIATGASIVAATGFSAAGVAMAGSSSAMLAAAGGAIVALGPLVAVILVGTVTAIVLNKIDEHYHITDHVIAALDELSEKGVRGIIVDKKRELIHAANQIANNIAETVIDYVVVGAERVCIHFLRNLTARITMPTM